MPSCAPPEKRLGVTLSRVVPALHVTFVALCTANRSLPSTLHRQYYTLRSQLPCSALA